MDAVFLSKEYIKDMLGVIKNLQAHTPYVKADKKRLCEFLEHTLNFDENCIPIYGNAEIKVPQEEMCITGDLWRVPHFCINCIHFPASARKYKVLPIPESVECDIEHHNFVTGEVYRKECREKNHEGECEDFVLREGL